VLSTVPAVAVLAGVNVNVGLGAGELMANFALAGAPGVAGAGYATLKLPVPAIPALSGLTMFSQWFVWDGGVPTGAATSRGAEVRLF
jgi:hypothetical protein